MKKILKYLKNDSGQATVLVAAILIAILGITALAVDVGNVYLEKSKMQKALDAAVLGGAQLLMTESEGASEAKAAEISNNNGFPLSVETEVEASSVNYYVKATKEKEVEMYFAKVLGYKTMTIKAKAKAVIRPISGLRGLVPVAVEKDAIPSNVYDKLTMVYVDNLVPGNVGFVDLDGTIGGGANDLVHRIENGYSESVSTSSPDVEKDGIYTETGKTDGAYDEFKARIEYDMLNNSDKCGSAETADYSCKRLVYVPIIESWTDEDGEILTGAKEVDVIGFAVFFLNYENVKVPNDEKDKEGKKDKEENKFAITGQFVTRLTQGELEELFDDSKDFGLYGVKLTE
ncbi:Tad domain-containing protein [Neobacillus sp. LXY-4]|uniref:Tad domain-containing protein n=1 Tax=Neobacillus sp. LXY-4 TaxID=3379826 RepID=UPI003EE23B44